MRVLLDGEFFAEWQHDLEELARFAEVDVKRLSKHPEDEAKEAREKKKKQRGQSLKSLKVTTAAGNEYDADEESQNRMIVYFSLIVVSGYRLISLYSIDLRGIIRQYLAATP